MAEVSNYKSNHRNNKHLKHKRSWIKTTLIGVFSLLLLVVLIGYWLFRSSLPELDGELSFQELSQTVTIERDKMGLVTISSTSRTDSAFAMGFVHAQERFFQMDLLRRSGAGELSELFGKLALKRDKRNRVHRFRARAKRFMAAFPEYQKQIFSSYTKGVNAGLKALETKPFEYYLLQTEPQQWQIEDSLLTSYAMYFDLQSSFGRLEWHQHLLRQSLPEELTKFLLPNRSFWDAPIQEDSEVWEQQALPSLHSKLTASIQSRQIMEQDLRREESSRFGVIGSNNWAIGGTMTKSGAAIMADDMHLGLSVPNTWFRMRLLNPDGSLDVNGVSLPGGPLIVAGSNTYVAWGFTNSYGDWGDLIQLKLNPEDSSQYLTEKGYQTFTEYSEIIKVKGKDSSELIVKETIWGPVVTGASNEMMAYQWVAHYPQGMNGGLLAMEKMKSVEQTLSIVDSIGMPAQNAILADKFGNIAWTIFGAIPQRRYPEASLIDSEQKLSAVNYIQPADWSDGKHGWDGWLQSEQYPRVKNPVNYRLWTANTRVVTGKDLAIVGKGHYALGARAKQIRDGLLQLKGPIREQDLLQVQLDDRAIFLSRWQQLLVGVIEKTESKKLKIFQESLQQWGERASVDSVGYRLVKEFRLKVSRTLFASITAPCKEMFPQCNYYRATHLWEEPLWTLVTEKNPAWLPEKYSQWQNFFEKMIEETFSAVLNGEQNLEKYTWGAKNQIKIKHPLSRGVPGLSLLTDMPVKSYSGDRDMPKAATSRFGASERMIISPGHEADAILHMPTSQSGHPLSPYYGKGHEDWVEGRATPLLPGETEWTLRLVP